MPGIRSLPPAFRLRVHMRLVWYGHRALLLYLRCVHLCFVVCDHRARLSINTRHRHGHWLWWVGGCVSVCCEEYTQAPAISPHFFWPSLHVFRFFSTGKISGDAARSAITITAKGEPKSGTTWLGRLLPQLALELCGSPTNTW